MERFCAVKQNAIVWLQICICIAVNQMINFERSSIMWRKKNRTKKESFQIFSFETVNIHFCSLFSSRVRLAWRGMCKHRTSTSFANGNYLYEIGMLRKEHRRKVFSYFFAQYFLVYQRAKDSNLYFSGCSASLCLTNLICSFMNGKYVNIYY